MVNLVGLAAWPIKIAAMTSRLPTISVSVVPDAAIAVVIGFLGHTPTIDDGIRQLANWVTASRQASQTCASGWSSTENVAVTEPSAAIHSTILGSSPDCNVVW